MAGKTSKVAPTDEEVAGLFEGLGHSAITESTKTKASATATAAAATEDYLDEIKNDLDEIENVLREKQPSRPLTPRVRETASKLSSTKKASGETAALDAGRLSEEKPANVARKSGESTRSYHASFTPSATSSDLQDSEKKGTVEQSQAPAASGGGWWGGLMSTATAAMKQAEAAVKEIQQNEEARKWADQVRGNVGALRGLGDELRHRALPTFTNILHTIAPPISSHERLLIHITHDLVGYPSLDPLVYGVFNRVMSQVEGGELLVIQRGQESTIRSPPLEKTASSFFGGHHLNAAGWRDGPWWRQSDSPRDLGLVKGLTAGTKLCRASAEAYSSDYFNAHGGLEEARRRAIEPVSESNPVRSSDLFLSVQAISVESDKTLFAGTTATEKEKEDSSVLEEDAKDEMVCFAVFVLDSVHEIQFATVSQHFPVKWIRWLDAAAPLTPASTEDGPAPEVDHVPEEIREIVDSGGVDPREWVAEWVEEVITLAVGVVAQRYVARRMGVGEGGPSKGKRKVDNVIQEGGGEVARAGLI